MPVISNEDKVVVSVRGTPTRHTPDSFQGRLAEQRTAEGDVLAVAAIDVVCKTMEARMVDKYPVHTV